MARPKLGDSDTERLHMKITVDELKAIDEWRYENRIPSRSEAVRRLCQIALAVDRDADAIKAAWLAAGDRVAAALEEPIRQAGRGPHEPWRVLNSTKRAADVFVEAWKDLGMSLGPILDTADIMTTTENFSSALQDIGQFAPQHPETPTDMPKNRDHDEEGGEG